MSYGKRVALIVAAAALVATAAIAQQLHEGRHIFDGVTIRTAGGLNLAGTAVTATGAELNALDGLTATVAELNILDGVTSTAAELNILDGVTSTAAELNILDGVTSTAAELNILDGVTSTAAELNILDGVTSTAAELNILDGVTATATEINSLAGTKNVLVCENTVAYTDTTAKAICTIPADADVIGITVNVTTGFDDTGTDVLDLGVTGTAEHFKADLDVTSTGQTVTGWNNFGDVGASPITVEAIYTGQNTNANAGAATVIILYFDE